MKPLLTAFLKVVGMNKTSQHGTPNRCDGGRGESAVRRSGKSKPNTGLSDFSVLEEGRDEWSLPTTKDSSNDELPLNSIQGHREYEQKIENGHP